MNTTLLGQTTVLLATLLISVLTPTRSGPQVAPAPCGVEQVALRTADGVRLDGLLYRAVTTRPAALVLVHGHGGNFYSAYFPALAQAAATQGYDTLAVNMRDHDSGPKRSSFIDNEADIAAAAAHLRNLGHKRLALLGQSMGTNRVLYYQAASGDPDIAATVLVSSPGDLFEWNVWQFGKEKAQATVDDALKLQAVGHEDQFMLVDLGPLGRALYTARYLLSQRGPERRSNPYQNVQRVTGRLLIVQGTADKLIASGIGQRLQQAAPPASKAELQYVDGADHGFSNHGPELIHRVLTWLKAVTP
jgi:pimeloyl-ACP methyl ester carboxylesterase